MKMTSFSVNFTSFYIYLILNIYKNYYKEHKEEILEKSLLYYNQNKEKVKQKGKEYHQKNREKLLNKKICECGSKVAYSGISRHLKTAKHLANIIQKQNIQI